MTNDTNAVNLEKLHLAIVNGLEDLNALDIVVFDTDDLSPLFSRVIIASGVSNRQIIALTASVRDSVCGAGFEMPRTEGEDQGEWIIMDCGSAIVHIMLPAIRKYYKLEETWGAKPVLLPYAAQTRAKSVQPELNATTKVASKAHVDNSIKFFSKSLLKVGAIACFWYIFIYEGFYTFFSHLQALPVEVLGEMIGVLIIPIVPSFYVARYLSTKKGKNFNKAWIAGTLVILALSTVGVLRGG